jgi:hypothetical protein
MKTFRRFFLPVLESLEFGSQVIRYALIFVILNHSRRQVVHLAVRTHPTMAWVIQQLREAMPFASAFFRQRASLGCEMVTLGLARSSLMLDHILPDGVCMADRNRVAPNVHGWFRHSTGHSRDSTFGSTLAFPGIWLDGPLSVEISSATIGESVLLPP